MTDAQAELLAQISAATIDRMLADQRSRMRLRSRTRTRPGSLLKHQIPIRTFADWDDTAPGFVEIDLVAHDGCIATGECYLHAHHDRHRHRLDHQPAGAQPGPQAGRGGHRSCREPVPLPDQGYRLRQWQRVHQPSTLRLIHRRRVDQRNP